MLQDGEANPLDQYEPVEEEMVEEDEGEDLMENMERYIIAILSLIRHK